MRRRRLFAATAVAAFAAFAQPGAAQPAPAEDEPEFFLEVPPPEDAYPLRALEQFLVPRSAPQLAREHIKSVISIAPRPDTSKGPITVCFYDGTDDLAGRVAAAARGWELAGSSVKFDFGNSSAPRRCEADPRATIRISFNGQGTWSLIGSQSRFATRATMSFDRGRDWAAVSQREFDRIVKHEFGHALGLFHEHQHPAMKCAEEIDWPRALELYRSANYNLGEDVIRSNFAILVSEYSAGDFDNRSIMIYDIPRSIFRRELFSADSAPSCYFATRSYEISDGDRAAILKYYPTDLNAVRALRIAAFEEYRSLVAPYSGSDRALGVASAFYAFDDLSDAKPYIDYGESLLRREAVQKLRARQ